ncbi:hypothetical protein L873DRAFT_1891535, partial [Choiromyces venosus 120613-1]
GLLCFASRLNRPSTSPIHKCCAKFYLIAFKTLSHYEYRNLTPLPIEHRGSSSRGEPSHYGISNTHTDSAMSNNVSGNSNTNVGNVSNSYNNTINVGVNEETKQIQKWLSLLEPHVRH